MRMPWAKGNIGACREEVAKKGERRTSGFGCFFYDGLVVENPNSIPDIKPSKISVEILAEDGKKPAPKRILAGTMLKLKAVPNQGTGAFSWKSKTKAIKVENESSESVSLSVVNGEQESSLGEVIELIFTPSGQPSQNPVTHTISVVKAMFMKNDTHAWGYDEYSEIPAKDQNWNKFKFKPDSKLDILSVQSGKTGLVDLHYKGSEGKDLFFKAKDDSANYDMIKNGALDLELGTESVELKHLIAACQYKGTRVIHVHSLGWSYFLASDVGPSDTKIKLKSYGRYLDFVGTNNYVLEDTSGKSVTIKIKSVDRENATFELSQPLGVELKVANKAALLWPLGGLSTLVGIVAHELGHSNAGLKDIAEISNIMHGVAEGNERIRGRDLPLFYHPDKLENQWAKMPRRS
jgi:hypothetical protein